MPTPVVFGSKEFHERILRHDSAPLIQIQSESDLLRGRIVLLRDSQYDALSGKITHADFYEVDMDHKIRIPVVLHFVGKAVGLLNGGILQPIRREVEVECFPASIPESIEVDVSHLEMHESIHVSQLSLPDGVSVPFDSDYTLVTVASPTTSDREGEMEAAQGEDAGAVIVVGASETKE